MFSFISKRHTYVLVKKLRPFANRPNTKYIALPY